MATTTALKPAFVTVFRPSTKGFGEPDEFEKLFEKW